MLVVLPVMYGIVVRQYLHTVLVPYSGSVRRRSRLLKLLSFPASHDPRVCHLSLKQQQRDCPRPPGSLGDEGRWAACGEELSGSFSRQRAQPSLRPEHFSESTLEKVRKIHFGSAVFIWIERFCVLNRRGRIERFNKKLSIVASLLDE